MTHLISEPRSGIANAICLCQLCADVIDRGACGLPAMTLAEWRRISEQSAARDSVVTVDVLTELTD
jgi:hypothetical protein